MPYETSKSKDPSKPLKTKIWPEIKGLEVIIMRHIRLTCVQRGQFGA